MLLSEVIKNKEATNEYFLGHSDKKKIQALPKKMGECHDINYVEYVYYVIMYLIINNYILDNLKVKATFLSNINVTSRWQI